jgi:hypothetical protein
MRRFIKRNGWILLTVIYSLEIIIRPVYNKSWLLFYGPFEVFLLNNSWRLNALSSPGHYIGWLNDYGSIRWKGLCLVRWTGSLMPAPYRGFCHLCFQNLFHRYWVTFLSNFFFDSGWNWQRNLRLERYKNRLDLCIDFLFGNYQTLWLMRLRFNFWSLILSPLNFNFWLSLLCIYTFGHGDIFYSGLWISRYFLRSNIWCVMIVIVIIRISCIWRIRITMASIYHLFWYYSLSGQWFHYRYRLFVLYLIFLTIWSSKLLVAKLSMLQILSVLWLRVVKAGINQRILGGVGLFFKLVIQLRRNRRLHRFRKPI